MNVGLIDMSRELNEIAKPATEANSREVPSYGAIRKQLNGAVEFIQTIKDCGIADCNHDNWLGRLMKCYLEENGDLYK